MKFYLLLSIVCLIFAFLGMKSNADTGTSNGLLVFILVVIAIIFLVLTQYS